MDGPWNIDLSIYDNEDELLEGLKRRDRFACSCLMKRYMPRLYRLALQITGNTDDAEDVLQESLIQACDKVEQFEGRSALGSWLHRIVVNNALMHLRRRKAAASRTEQSSDAASALAEEVADDRMGPGEHALSRELREKVDQAILALPDSLRSAFVLRDVEGMSTLEAAEALGITEPALKVRLHRARMALREALASYVHGRSEEQGPGAALQGEKV